MHFLGRQLFPDSKNDGRRLRQVGSVRIDLGSERMVKESMGWRSVE